MQLYCISVLYMEMDLKYIYYGFYTHGLVIYLLWILGIFIYYGFNI